MNIEWRRGPAPDCRELDSTQDLDQDRLAVFRQYLAQEYAGPFIHGMGSYEILDMVGRFAGQGRRLDVGSGTASLFWILAASGKISTTATDVEPEALVVLKDLLSAPRALPDCYYQAAALFDVSPTRVEELRRSIDSYLVFNALTTWPGRLTRSDYDLVTAFGCFAIAGSAAAYRDCFRNAAAAVKAGGRILGADWIRHPDLQTRDYSFVTGRTLRTIGAELGLPLRHVEEVAVRGHETYGGVVLWAFEKP